MNDDTYNGYHLVGLDKKGRLSIPAPFRQVMEARSGNRGLLVLRQHYRDGAPCILASDVRMFAEEKARLEARRASMSEDEYEDKLTEVFGFTLKMPLEDKTGRFSLPAEWRNTNQITDDVFLLGQEGRFQIWAPELLVETLGRKYPHLVAMIASQRRNRANGDGEAA